MAAHLLLSFILALYLGASQVHPQVARFHVSQEGKPITLFCPPHDETYTVRHWFRSGNLLRPTHVIYTQDNGGAVNATGARPDMSLNLADWSLTIGSLQVEDTGYLYCEVDFWDEWLDAATYLLVYNRLVEVKYDRSATLQCPGAFTGFTTRQWYTQPFSANLIYKQTPSGVTQGPEARDDMSLDTGSFTLTVGIVKWLDLVYTCHVTRPGITSTNVIFLGILTGSETEVEENTSVTVPCDGAMERTRLYSSKPYTRTWQRVNGDVLYYQFLFNGVFYEYRPAARADISLNNETFALTLARAQLEDDNMFICTFEYPIDGIREVYLHLRSMKRLIFIQPKIIMSGIDETPVNVGTTVTVTCTIGRVYPELGPNDFQLRWGNQTVMSKGSQNKDKSYSYSIQYTRTVVIDDHWTTVQCIVFPRRGRSTSKTLNVNVQNQASPPDGVSPPVIGAAAAAAAVGIILIIILVISVCVCIRTKAKVDNITNQGRRTHDSHHRQEVRSVSRRDETHPPEYDNMASQDQGRRTHDSRHRQEVHSVGRRDETSPPASYYHEYDNTASHGTRSSNEHWYEKLKVKASTPIDKWFKGIPKATVRKLKRHDIVTIQHLQEMSRADMVEAGLNVGERNMIRRALKEMRTSRF